MIVFFEQAFVRFALVGASGFLVDVACMLLFSTWLPFIWARGVAFWIAATSNWWLNRTITFAQCHDARLTATSTTNTVSIKNWPSRKAALLQWLQFLGGSVIAFVPNWGCYVALLSFHNNVTHHTLYIVWPYLAMAPGVILGMTINYVFSRFWIFNPNK